SMLRPWRPARTTAANPRVVGASSGASKTSDTRPFSSLLARRTKGVWHSCTRSREPSTPGGRRGSFSAYSSSSGSRNALGAARNASTISCSESGMLTGAAYRGRGRRRVAVYPLCSMVRLPPSVHVGPQGPMRGTLKVPGSKSITNRALVAAALADGTSVVDGALIAEDSEVMIRALAQLGVAVEVQGTSVVVRGAGGPPPAAVADLDLRLSGTSIRFLTALAALGHGRYRLDGNARMRQRPIQDLLDALGELGANATTDGHNGCPP